MEADQVVPNDNGQPKVRYQTVAITLDMPRVKPAEDRKAPKTRFKSIAATMDGHVKLARELNARLQNALGESGEGARVEIPSELLDDVLAMPVHRLRKPKITVEKVEQLLASATSDAESERYKKLARKTRSRERAQYHMLRKGERLRETHAELRRIMYTCNRLLDQLLALQQQKQEGGCA